MLTFEVEPAELGLFDADVSMTAEAEAPGESPSTPSIYVVGWGSGFDISPESDVDLGDVPTDTAVSRALTVTTQVAISDFQVWTVGEAFTVDASATTCTATLAAGDSCVVTVQFIAPSPPNRRVRGGDARLPGTLHHRSGM